MSKFTCLFRVFSQEYTALRTDFFVSFSTRKNWHNHKCRLALVGHSRTPDNKEIVIPDRTWAEFKLSCTNLFINLDDHSIPCARAMTSGYTCLGIHLCGLIPSEREPWCASGRVQPCASTGWVTLFTWIYHKVVRNKVGILHPRQGLGSMSCPKRRDSFHAETWDFQHQKGPKIAVFFSMISGFHWVNHLARLQCQCLSDHYPKGTNMT